MAGSGASGSCEVDGARLEYRWWGSPTGGGPVVVLLHEGLGSVDQWKDVPADIHSATGLTVFAYSRRGYGRSSPLGEPRAPGYMHHEALVVLPQVLAAAGIGDPILVGHSDGASIALIAAGAGACPVRAMVTMAAHIYVEQVCVDHIATMDDGDGGPEELVERLGRYHTDPEATLAGWRDIWLDPVFRSWDIRGHLPGIDCPVLVVQGRDDPFNTVAMVDGLVAAVSGRAEPLLLADCGHIVHRDQPELLVAAIARFVAGVC